nr:unnamed protein product [Digitaria exilis]
MTSTPSAMAASMAASTSEEADSSVSAENTALYMATLAIGATPVALAPSTLAPAAVDDVWDPWPK